MTHTAKLLSTLIVATGFSFLGCASKQALLQDEQLLQELMAEHQNNFQACYEVARSQNPQLGSGEIIVRAEHASNGIFVDLRQLKGFTGSGPVYDCLAEQIRLWKTERPRTRGSVDLSWKFEADSPSLGQRLSQLTKEEVERVLKANQQDFDTCLSDLREQDPRFEGGNVEFEIQVKESGELETLDLTSGFPGSRKILSCLEKRAKSAWVFPERDAPSTLSWSWDFRVR